MPKWGVTSRQGQHEGLISVETFQRIQDRRAGKAITPARKDIKEEFPLRGFVTCADCGEPLRSCWSKGRSARYPYYLCQTRDCPSYGKSIRRETIEGEFETLLRGLVPTKGLFELATQMFETLWNRRADHAQARAKSLKRRVGDIERQVEHLLDRIVDASTPSVVRAYEARIQKLEEEKLVVAEAIAQQVEPARSFGETLRTALAFLANPWRLWASERLEDKRTVLKLTFSDRLAYARNGGFRTAALSLPFKVLRDLTGPESEMVRMEGLEPPRVSPPEPKSGASTNFATSALHGLISKIGQGVNCGRELAQRLLCWERMMARSTADMAQGRTQ